MPTTTAAQKKKVYSNDLMIKLRHMAPQPPSLASIPEGARAIFMLPDSVSTTVHTVTVQKKPKNQSAAIASGGFTVRAESPSTARPTAESQSSSPFGTAASSTLLSFDSNNNVSTNKGQYAAALKAMTDAEREKLQEVRNAFMLRAAEGKLLAAAAAAAAANAEKVAAATPPATANNAGPWNTSALGAPAKPIDIAAEVLKKSENNKAKTTQPPASASDASTRRSERKDVSSKEAASSAPRRWAANHVDAVALSEILPSAPMTRSERKRATTSHGLSSSPSAKNPSTGRGGRKDENTDKSNNNKKTRSSTTVGNKSSASPARAGSQARGASSATVRGVVERFPAFMVIPNVVINGNAPTTAPESFFVGPDGRQYPMPSNPFTDLAARMAMAAADGNNASAATATFVDGAIPQVVGAPPLMGFSEWYAWWAQQASFFPQFYPVPVEVPVDSAGNVLPFSVLTELREGERKQQTEEYKKQQRLKAKQNETADGNAKKRGGAGKGGKKATTAATDDAEEVHNAAVIKENEAMPAVSLVKGRTAPAVLSVESLAARHRQRERQIVLGKRTMGYLIYERMRAAGAATAPTRRPAAATGSTSSANRDSITDLLNNAATGEEEDKAPIEAAPESTVTKVTAPLFAIDIPSDCHAPPFAQPCSKRSWDGQVRRWRNALHKLDKYADLFLTAEEIASFAMLSHALNYENDEEENDMDGHEDEEVQPQIVADAVVASLNYDE